MAQYKSFGKSIDFPFAVPSDYHQTFFLERFMQKFKQEDNWFNMHINSNNFVNSEDRIQSGCLYIGKFFPIEKRVSSYQCLEFLKNQKAILSGAYGLSLIWEYRKSIIPKAKWLVSFDEKSKLWNDGDELRIPCLFQRMDDSWKFDLGFYRYAWDSNAYLFAIFNKRIAPL